MEAVEAIILSNAIDVHAFRHFLQSLEEDRKMLQVISSSHEPKHGPQIPLGTPITNMTIKTQFNVLKIVVLKFLKMRGKASKKDV